MNKLGRRSLRNLQGVDPRLQSIINLAMFRGRVDFTVIEGLRSEKRQQELYDFGIDLGLLFQIQDDIIDVTQTTQEAGKPTQNDDNKNSFITLLGLKRSINEADTLANELEDKFQKFDTKLQKKLEPLMQKYLNRHHKKGK